MAMNKLGKGLSDLGVSELLGEVQAPASLVGEVVAETTDPREGSLKRLPVEQIKPGRYQPRKIMDQEGLQELADSIKSQGVIQPIIVRNITNGSYEIIAGERRWRAAQQAGLDKIPAIVRNIPNETAMAIGLIENIQRRDLNVIEEASAMQRLIEEFQMTHQEVSEAVGKSRAAVTNYLRILKLNPDVRVLVEAGKLEMGHARALLALEGLTQSEIANQIINKGLSVRATETLIRHLQLGKKSNTARTATDPDILRLQNDLSEKLGAKIAIQHSAKGKGKLVISYNSSDELEGILEHIQ